MKADYDSHTDALLIDLLDADRCDNREEIEEPYCGVELENGRAANVELLSPRDHLELLDRAAERFGIDREAMQAAAQAALAAPDRPIKIDIAARILY
jgi:uncharacterized protein YuzE